MRPEPSSELKFLLLLALVASLSGPGVLVWSAPARNIYYSFSFDHDGNTYVNVTFTDDQANGVVWVVVPKAPTHWDLRVLGGTLQRSALAGAGSMVFYDNLTLYYSGPVKIAINWTMQYGALLLEPQGLFVSPAIFASGDANGYATLRLPNEVQQITSVTPQYTQVSPDVLQFDLKQVMQNGEGRIYVYFTTSGQQDVREFTRGNYTVSTASRYGALAERVLSAYVNSTRVMQSLFNESLGHTYVTFFVPQSPSDMPVGGFVPIEPNTFSVGNISLNLFYFRTEEGYIEAIALHELVHQYIAKAGVPPTLLWLHEGLANYISIGVTYYLGLTGAKDLEDSLTSTAADIPQSEYHVVEAWSPSYTDPNYSEFQHYAMAYAIVSAIGSAFPVKGQPFRGYGFYNALFSFIEANGQHPNSTLQIVSDMELVAPNGSEVASLFSMWGFDIPNVQQIYAQIQSLRNELQNPSPLLSLFVPSMMAKLDEAERLLKNNDLAAAQEIVNEVDAFINRIWLLLAALLMMGIALAFTMVFSRKTKRAIGANTGLGP
jgi:hypothetical protein